MLQETRHAARSQIHRRVRPFGCGIAGLEGEVTARFHPGRGSQMTKQDRQAIQEFALINGIPQAEIARRTGRDRGTVAAVLKADETKQLELQLAASQKDRALAILHRHTATAAESWHEAVAVAAGKGDHRPAKDLLLHTDVIRPLDTNSGGVRVEVVLNGGDLPHELRSDSDHWSWIMARMPSGAEPADPFPSLVIVRATTTATRDAPTAATTHVRLGCDALRG